MDRRLSTSESEPPPIQSQSRVRNKPGQCSERELVLIVDRATWGSRLYLKEQVPWEAWWAKTSGEEARGLGEGLGGGEEELLLRGWWQVGLSSRCSTLMRPPLLRLLHPTTPRSLVDLCADSAGAAGNVPTRNSNLPPSGAAHNQQVGRIFSSTS